MVEDPLIGRQDGVTSHTHTQGIVNLQRLKDDFDLHDQWCLTHPTNRTFTWRSRKTADQTQSRLDRFYLTPDIVYIHSDVLFNVWPDHKIINIRLQVGKPEERGPNYWKLNTDILAETEYRTLITDFYQQHRLTKPDYRNPLQW